jgi:hypothetical protein
MEADVAALATAVTILFIALAGGILIAALVYWLAPNDLENGW